MEHPTLQEYNELQELYYVDMDSSPATDLQIYLLGREQVRPGISCERVLRKHYILHFIMQGKGSFQQGNDTYIVEEGQAFLITPDIFCSYVADKEDPYTYVWVEFDGLSAKDCLNKAGISRSHPVYTGIDGSCMEYLRQMILHHDNLLQVQAYLLLIFNSLIVNCPPKLRPVPENTESASETYIRHAMKYIALNYWKDPSVQDMAEFCGINRSHLSRIFKQKTNQSPQEYLARYRINTACTFLRTTDLSLSQIAIALGYADQFSFSKAFKKEKGMPPSVWKQQNI
ncbi:MAG: AraC family transcriptional regulator [Lachnospiraceae bacterium]|nr:AraC family transcriptional regulator [Lachnospiraceae bacterium]